MEYLSESNGLTLLRVYVQPGAKESAVVGAHGDRLKIKVKAPPVDGAANEELRRFVSELLGVSKSLVELLRGDMSRQKDLLIKISPAKAREILKIT